MTAGLLPCPFCGGRSAVTHNDLGWRVFCANAHGHCVIAPCTSYFETRDSAQAAWNFRPLFCRKCGGHMRPSKALQSTECKKCVDCGWSVINDQ